MFCRNCGQEIDNKAVVCTNCGVRTNDGTNYCQNCGYRTDELAVVCTNCGVQLKKAPSASRNKIVAGLLGLFLGAFGIHNFYLGYNQRGLTQLLISTIGGIFTCGIATVVIEIWSLVEAIRIFMGDVNDVDGCPLI